MDDDFYHLMAQAGFNRLSLAKWLGVSERTINRWSKHGAPLVTVRALQLHWASKSSHRLATASINLAWSYSTGFWRPNAT